MRKTKLGIGSFCFPYGIGVGDLRPLRPLTLRDLVDKAVKYQVEVLQVGDNFPLETLKEEELKDAADYAKEKGIQVELGMRGLTKENLDRYLYLLRIFGGSLLRCVVDRGNYQPDLGEIHRILRKYRGVFEKNQVVFGIENHDRFTSGEFRKLMEDSRDERIGIVLDTVNSFSCQENTEQVMENLAPYTVNFHVKDFVIRRSNCQMGLTVTGVPAGEGFLKIPEMLERLKQEAQQDFSSILELWMEPEADVESTIKKEEEWVAKSIKYLKTIKM